MKTKKKLMIIIWNMGIGGVQKRVKDITIDISQNYPDWQLYLLVKHKQSSLFLDEINLLKNIEIRYCSASHRISKKLPSFFWVLKNYLSIKPDVCLTFLDHLSVSMVLMKYIIFWQKVKLVLNEGVYTGYYLILNKRHFFWKYLIKIFYPFADSIIVPTHAIKDHLSQDFSVHKEKIRVIPNWTLFQEKVIGKKKYDLAFIGRFETEKNPMEFVLLIQKLLPLLPNIKSVMMGSGKQEEEIWSFIQKNKLNNNIDLIQTTNKPQAYLKQTKLLVMTTLNEGMPNVVLEAGILQVPTISNNFYGADEIISDGKNGYLTTNISEMVTKTYHLLKDGKKRKLFGLTMKKKVEKDFSQSRQKEFISFLLAEN